MASSQKDPLKRFLLRNLSPANLERAKILSRGFRDFRDTFRTGHKSLLAPGTIGYPLSIREIRENLEECGIQKGDVVHVQSSTSFLMRGGKHPPTETYSSTLEYAIKVVEMLKDLVGTSGTLLMSTDSIKNPYDFYLKNQVFDYLQNPSNRGLISEVFRRGRGAVRSVHPWYNVTAYGRDAESLVMEHHLSNPFAMDSHSPWHKLLNCGGKVALLGKTFDTNSLIHGVEFMHPDEFPRPIFIGKPITLKYIDRDRSIKIMPVMLHARVWVDGSPTRFSMYLNEKCPIYKIKEFQAGVKIVTYNAKDQFDAIYQEMKNGVTWYDARFHPLKSFEQGV